MMTRAYPRPREAGERWIGPKDRDGEGEEGLCPASYPAEGRARDCGLPVVRRLLSFEGRRAVRRENGP